MLNTVPEHDSHDIRQNQILDKREIQLEKRRQMYRESSETTEARNNNNTLSNQRGSISLKQDRKAMHLQAFA